MLARFALSASSYSWRVDLYDDVEMCMMMIECIVCEVIFYCVKKVLKVWLCLIVVGRVEDIERRRVDAEREAAANVEFVEVECVMEKCCLVWVFFEK